MKNSKKAVSSKKCNFPLNVKRRAVEEFKMGLYSQIEICEKYHITRNQLNSWNRWYERTWSNPFYQQKMKKKAKEQEDIRVLRRALKTKTKALEEAEFRIMVLEKLISVSERDLGVSIKKNSGTQSSPK